MRNERQDVRRSPRFRARWCLVVVLCIVAGWPLAGAWAASGAYVSGPSGGLFERGPSSHGSSSDLVRRVDHHPAGSTMYHDYYDKSTNPKIAHLVRLVEGAHVKNILPNLQQYFQVHENLKEGRLKSAWGEIKYTLERLVNHPKALALSGTVAKLMNRPESPKNFFHKAITMYPHRPMPHAQYGKFLIELGEIEAGIERLKVATKVSPKLGVAHAWLAFGYQKNGQDDLADETMALARKKGYRGKGLAKK